MFKYCFSKFSDKSAVLKLLSKAIWTQRGVWNKFLFLTYTRRVKIFFFGSLEVGLVLTFTSVICCIVYVICLTGTVIASEQVCAILISLARVWTALINLVTVTRTLVHFEAGYTRAVVGIEEICASLVSFARIRLTFINIYAQQWISFAFKTSITWWIF